LPLLLSILSNFPEKYKSFLQKKETILGDLDSIGSSWDEPLGMAEPLLGIVDCKSEDNLGASIARAPWHCLLMVALPQAGW
jgi:hypothetical protein